MRSASINRTICFDSFRFDEIYRRVKVTPAYAIDNKRIFGRISNSVKARLTVDRGGRFFLSLGSRYLLRSAVVARWTCTGSDDTIIYRRAPALKAIADLSVIYRVITVSASPFPPSGYIFVPTISEYIYIYIYVRIERSAIDKSSNEPGFVNSVNLYTTIFPSHESIGGILDGRIKLIDR